MQGGRLWASIVSTGSGGREPIGTAAAPLLRGAVGMSSAANDRIGRDDIRPAGSVEARESWAKTVFDHDRARHALRHAAMDSILASRPIAAGAGAAKLPARPRTLLDRLDLPEATATYLGVPALGIDLDQLLELVGTRGLLAWHGGEVVAERYLKSHSPDVRWMTNSASKLVVAMLVARAQQEGVLGADETLLTAYWPELVGTAWDGVTIGHCRQMTTGVAWEEESLDVSHDGGWPRLLKELAFGSIDSYPATVPRRDEPGDVVRYSSLDTEVLGGVLVRAAGAGIAELVERWLWQPAGMESDAYWLCDQGGREFALSGLCATLRDYARLGLIRPNRGSWEWSPVSAGGVLRQALHTRCRAVHGRGARRLPPGRLGTGLHPQCGGRPAGRFHGSRFLWADHLRRSAYAHSRGASRGRCRHHGGVHRSAPALHGISIDRPGTSRRHVSARRMIWVGDARGLAASPCIASGVGPRRSVAVGLGGAQTASSRAPSASAGPGRSPVEVRDEHTHRSSRCHADAMAAALGSAEAAPNRGRRAATRMYAAPSRDRVEADHRAAQSGGRRCCRASPFAVAYREISRRPPTRQCAWLTTSRGLVRATVFYYEDDTTQYSTLVPTVRACKYLTRPK